MNGSEPLSVGTADRETVWLSVDEIEFYIAARKHRMIHDRDT